MKPNQKMLGTAVAAQDFRRSHRKGE